MKLTAPTATAYDNNIWRKTKNGVQQVEVPFSEYGEPLDREHKLLFTGYSDEYEKDTPWGPKQKLKLEFKIVGGKSNGIRFTTEVTTSLDPRAKLAEILTALRGEPIEEGQEIDLDDYLGKSLYGMTNSSTSEKGYTYVNIPAVRVDDDDDEDEVDEPPVKTNGKSNGKAKASTDDEDEEFPEN